MAMHDFIATMTKPAPDSQFRLLPCSCGSNNVAYGERCTPSRGREWAVGCMNCGKVTDWHTVRHHAQLEWNGRERPSWDRD
jgi:hypothetical protein